MESLAPPLRLLIHVKRSIERGSSVKTGILSFIKSDSEDFSSEIKQWLAHFEHGQSTKSIIDRQKSIYRRTLLTLLERGLRGDAIYQSLNLLEEETVMACQLEQAHFLSRLPFLLLLPLLFFMFPAFLLLLFGPLLGQFVSSLSGQGL